MVGNISVQEGSSSVLNGEKGGGGGRGEEKKGNRSIAGQGAESRESYWEKCPALGKEGTRKQQGEKRGKGISQIARKEVFP